jgi:hypothetical protein
MLCYLNELNRGANENEPENRMVHKDANIIAWECVKRTLKPTSAQREEALLAISGEDANTRLNYLQNKLHILQVVKPAEQEIRFALDPLAEYLASIHIVETFEECEEKWDYLFERIDKYPANEIQGFLLAIQESIQIKMKEICFPESVMKNLKTRIESILSSPSL